MNVTSQGYFTSSYLDKNKQFGSPGNDRFDQYDPHLDPQSYQQQYQFDSQYQQFLQYQQQHQRNAPEGYGDYGTNTEYSSFNQHPQQTPQIRQQTLHTQPYKQSNYGPLTPPQSKTNQHQLEGLRSELHSQPNGSQLQLNNALSSNTENNQPSLRHTQSNSKLAASSDHLQAPLRHSASHDSLGAKTLLQPTSPNESNFPSESSLVPASPAGSLGAPFIAKKTISKQASNDSLTPSKTDKDQKNKGSSPTSQRSDLDKSLRTAKSANDKSLVKSAPESASSANDDKPPEKRKKTKRVLDPDHLTEEITPAQLNIIHENRNNNNRGYLPHQNRRSPYSPNLPFSNEPYSAANDPANQRSKTNKSNYNNYYINQKQRYDQAENKPKLYTPKTFREVFVNESETLDKYDPMEFVFRTEDTNEQEGGINIKRAYKNLRLKMGKDNYSNYDYYAAKAKGDGVFENPSEDDDDDDYDYDEDEEHDDDRPENAKGFVPVSDKIPEEDLTQEQRKQVKKNTRIKKLWKKKVKQAKRELSKNFSQNQVQQMELQKQIKSSKKAKEEVAAAEEASIKAPSIRSRSMKSEIAPSVRSGKTAKSLKTEKEYETGGSPTSSHSLAGPSDKFHPMWNSILDKIVYKTIDEDEEVRNVEVEEVPRIDANSIRTSRTMKSGKTSKSAKSARSEKKAAPKSKLAGYVPDWKNGYNYLSKNWYQPAATMFYGPPKPTAAEQAAAAAAAEAAHAGPSSLRLGRTGVESQSLYSLPQSYVDDELEENPREIILEVDGDDVQDELYFDQFRKVLGPEPPTSSDALAPMTGSIRTGRSGKSRRTLKSSKSRLAMKNAKDMTFLQKLQNISKQFDPKVPVSIMSNLNKSIKSIKIMSIIFAPIDVIAESFPTLQTLVIMLELFIFLWIMYELSRLVDALCIMVKAVCAPMIAMGRFMNKIM